jgi:hypothetical protein
MPNAFAEEPPPNGAAEREEPVKLDKPPPSGLDPPKPPPPNVPPKLEPPKPPKPEEPSPPKPDEALVAKGEALPKPPAGPNPPVACSGDASDPKPPDALVEVLLNAEKGDFSELENAERPDDANAEVEVADFSAGCSIGCPIEPSAARGDFDLENAAKGEADAVFAKPELGFT